MSTMDTDSFDELVTSAALGELTSGPLSIAELSLRLRHMGVFAHLRDLDEDELALELAVTLASTDATWMTDDGIVASTAVLLEGIKFSHRLTSSELERGVLVATPDLCVLDFDTDGQLSLSKGGHLKCTFDDDEELGEHLVFVGPTHWLANLGTPQIVVISRVSGAVSLHTDIELGHGETETRALRQAFDRLHSEGVLVEPTPIVFDALCRDPSLFHTPVPPIVDLFDRAGLECQGAWVGLKGESAEPPGVVYRKRLVTALGDEYGFNRCCSDAFEELLATWLQFVVDRTTPIGLRDTARALAHGAVAPAFAEFVLGDDDFSSALLEMFTAPLMQVGGKLSAPGYYLRALNLERDDRTLDAETALRAAIAADAGFAPALLELSWYAADRSDALRALSLLRRSGSFGDDPQVEYLTSRLNALVKDVGRNDPCPCGSGRKFKLCCAKGTLKTTEDTAEWLCHKVMMFSFRPQNRGLLEDLVDIASEIADTEVPDSIISFLANLVAFDPRALEHFLEARGVLLAEDEVTLVRAWRTSRPALFQVLTTEPGASIEVLDTRSGGSFVVTDRAASVDLSVGDYLLAHVVPAGSKWLFTGDSIRVPLVHRESLLALLSDDVATEDLAAWVGRLFAPISLKNYEGEAMEPCRALLAPFETWESVAAALDRHFERSGDDEWTEFVELRGEKVVRSFLRRESDQLVVETNSAERLDRVLASLQNIGGLEFLEEERIDLSSIRGVATTGTLDSLATSGDIEPSPEVFNTLRRYVREKEDAWLDERIPALGGLTPRQAAADPTRREDLAALLNEFERRDAPPGTATFDVQRLRQALGHFGT